MEHIGRLCALGEEPGWCVGCQLLLSAGSSDFKWVSGMIRFPFKNLHCGRGLKEGLKGGGAGSGSKRVWLTVLPLEAGFLGLNPWPSSVLL